MNPLMQQMQTWLGPNAKAIRALAAPLVVVMILAMMVLPLPPFALDLLFTFNIAMALMVMMVAAYMTRPLDFAAFPAVILLTTLLRLSLNVASTRVVLLEGHTGTGAAGAVIEAFGHFLIGGNFAVGLIVFAILVVINFVVVTKGAERIAEVGARFTLDAMPGKQMAIDADLNAGLIDEKEAKRRRAEVGEEAEFFGSMDGASKFVRGDAMAGMLILFINIIGGFVIGVVQHDLSASQAANSYILLAVGDALVAQIPALLISVAAAMVVSRVGKDTDVGSQIAQADVQLAAFALDHGRRDRRAGPDPRHAAPRVPADRRRAGLRRLVAEEAPDAGEERAAAGRRRWPSRTPKRAGTTCCRSTRSASKSATA